MVGNRQDAYLFGRDRVNERVRKSPHEMAALAVPPECSESGMLQQYVDRALKFREKRLGEAVACPLTIVFGCLPKIFFCFWM